MSVFPFFLIFIALVTFVSGQLFFKHAMESSRSLGFGAEFAKFFIPGIVSMAISFFLTLGLLQRFDLSYIYPFQGLSVIIISAMAAFVLKEKFTLQLAIGALLISVGVALVSLS